MVDIFISYAREDRSLAEKLASALQAHGWSVWWDVVIPAGRTFDEVIDEALDAAKCAVVLWSKSSVNSRYVRGEAQDAAERGVLVPVLIEKDIQIPRGFRAIHASDLTGWDGSSTARSFHMLTVDLARILGHPPLGVEEEHRKQIEREESPAPTAIYQRPVGVSLRQLLFELPRAARAKPKELRRWIYTPIAALLSGVFLSVLLLLSINPFNDTGLLGSEVDKFITLCMAVAGTTVGVAQWILVRSHHSRAGWWILTSAAGWGGCGGFLVGVLDVWAFDYFFDYAIAGATSAGVMQWFILRREFREGRWWIVANVVPWLFAWLGVQLFTNFAGPDDPRVEFAVPMLAFGFGILGWIVACAFTMIWLWWHNASRLFRYHS